ncbi:MAG: ComEA family DNA-binding protein [Gammaproteobacteria bacterium]
MTIRQFCTRTLTSLLLIGLGLPALAGPVNVNTADAATLAQELKGVGMAKAEAIVAYRSEHGPFTDLADLAQVKGIGVKLLEQNEQNVLLSD